MQETELIRNRRLSVFALELLEIISYDTYKEVVYHLADSCLDSEYLMVEIVNKLKELEDNYEQLINK